MLSTRIELVIALYQSAGMPLTYESMVDQRGIEPRPPRCKRGVLPLSLSAHVHCLASREGLEPPRTVLETVMLPLHHRDIDHNIYALISMRVVKQTAQILAMASVGQPICLTTLGFYTF